MFLEAEAAAMMFRVPGNLSGDLDKSAQLPSQT